jgi:hypothetical protein
MSNQPLHLRVTRAIQSWQRVCSGWPSELWLGRAEIMELEEHERRMATHERTDGGTDRRFMELVVMEADAPSLVRVGMTVTGP